MAAGLSIRPTSAGTGLWPCSCSGRRIRPCVAGSGAPAGVDQFSGQICAGRRLQAPPLSSWCSEVAAVMLLVVVVGVVTSSDGMCVVGGCRGGGPDLVDGVGFAASGVGGCCTVPLAAGAARMWCLCAVVCLALRGLVHRCVDDRFPSRVSALLVGSGPVDLFGLGVGRCGGRPGETLGLRRRPRRWRRLWRRFPPLRRRRGPLLPPP